MDDWLVYVFCKIHLYFSFSFGFYGTSGSKVKYVLLFERLYSQLAERMHVESSIVAKKIARVRKCIYYFMLSIIFLALTLVGIFAF